MDLKNQFFYPNWLIINIFEVRELALLLYVKAVKGAETTILKDLRFLPVNVYMYNVVDVVNCNPKLNCNLDIFGTIYFSLIHTLVHSI